VNFDELRAVSFGRRLVSFYIHGIVWQTLRVMPCDVCACPTPARVSLRREALGAVGSPPSLNTALRLLLKWSRPHLPLWLTILLALAAAALLVAVMLP
jgi:hypothetical protein